MPPHPSRILFVGNSLIFAGGGVDLAFQRLATAAGHDVTVDRQTVGGMTLATHARRPETLTALRDGGYDTVILQEQSNFPITDRAAFHAAVRDLVPIIRAAGAQPWLYMTWTYKQTFRELDPSHGWMTAQLADAYQTIGAELGVPVIPAGLIWQRALEETDLALYEDFHHQNETGAELVACVVLHALFGEVVESDKLGGGRSEAVAQPVAAARARSKQASHPPANHVSRTPTMPLILPLLALLTTAPQRGEVVYATDFESADATAGWSAGAQLGRGIRATLVWPSSGRPARRRGRPRCSGACPSRRCGAAWSISPGWSAAKRSRTSRSRGTASSSW